MPRLTPLAALGLTAVLGLAACGSDSSAGATPVTAGATAASTVAPGTASDATRADTASTASAAKVSANDASEAEIAAALSAAGVPNASRWAKEVTEYRPYPTDDPSLSALRKELAKYNPTDEVVNLIIGALQP